MATGTIKRFFDERGFGFIQPDDGGGDLFHVKGFVRLPWGVKPGKRDRVSFEIGTDPAKSWIRSPSLHWRSTRMGAVLNRILAI
jgi:cold shock protein